MANKTLKDRNNKAMSIATRSDMVFRRNGKSLEDEILIKGEQALNKAEREQVQKNIAPGGYLRSLFESAGALYNEETGFYEMNGLTDITEEEIIATYRLTYKSNGRSTDVISFVNMNVNSGYYPIRTNFPVNYIPNYGIKAFSLWFTSIEILNVSYRPYPIGESDICLWAGSFDFYAASSLRKVIGIIKFTGTSWTIVERVLPKLASIKFSGINKSVSLKGIQVMDYDSIKFAVDEATNTSSITITVYSTRYALLSGTATDEEYTATGHTKEEWMQIATDATAKQISFATTE